MSKFYNAQRKRNLFDPNSEVPFKLSRSKLENFIKCPRCFYLDRRLGVASPGGPGFSLNVAVDALLKKEFDVHRANQTPHPLMTKYGLDLVPFKHPQMDEWRDALRAGLQYLHEPTKLLITGGIDDIWANMRQKILFVVDYKATAQKGEITLEDEWKKAYKRQIEIYQWLLRKIIRGFQVANIGYFLYCNGLLEKEALDGKLEFDIKIISYEGNDDWVKQAIIDAHKCLMADALPMAAEDCDFCAYRKAAKKHEA